MAAVNAEEQQCAPESSERFMVTAILCVGRSRGYEKTVQPVFHELVSVGQRVVPSQITAGGDVCGVRPFLWRERAI